MKNLFSLGTLSVLASACVVALLCILPQTKSIFPFWVIASGAFIADTLFHELGHTLFNWLFGTPAIPMIFTLFGADQAGGMSMAWDRSWIVQGMAFAALAIALYWSYTERWLFTCLLCLTALVGALAFTPYYVVVILYMGHGSAILVGGWLLYRAWLYLDSRNGFERWLNAFFGFFLVLNNFYFSCMLAFDTETRKDYSEHTPFGISHDDFTAITFEITRWSVKGVALFTLGYCAVTILVSFLLAVMNSAEEED